mgnify:CR=1 FL=1
MLTLYERLVIVAADSYEGGDDLTLGNVKRDAGPMMELGASGLKRSAGYINEEFLPALKGRKAIQVFREMSENDPIVGALLFAVDRLLRQIEWRVEPASQKPEDKQVAEFIESCMDDMSHTWDEFISEVLTMLPYGWSWHEIVYKKRVGPWENDPRKRSKHNDGKIGWRKIPIRSQETLQRWVFDDTGGIKGMVQLAPPKYETVLIPIERSLLFRPSTVKNSPEGRSFLRNAYRPWYYKKRLEEIEGIGIERDLAGLPVAKVPHDYLSAKKGSEKAKVVDAFRKMVRSVRRDEQEGVVIPTQYDQDTKQPLFDFQLLTSGGGRTFDTNSIIQRYEQRILMTVLADFIMVGHEGTGSYALHTDKTGLFRASINSISQAIADVLNRFAIPRLLAINGMKVNEFPQFVPGDVDPPDLNQLSSFMGQMASAGVQWFPDPELEKFIRQAARLPKLDETKEQVLETEKRQAEVMRIAQQRMEALQLQQQAAQGVEQMKQAQMATEQQKMGLEQQARRQPLEEEQAAMQTAQQRMQTEHQAARMPHEQAQTEMQTEQQRIGLERESTHGMKQQEMQTRQQELSVKEQEELQRMTPEQRAKLNQKPDSKK